jgi:NADH dehydrogenase
MILVTGGTGFIGSALVRHLADRREPVRLLIHPSIKSPSIPKGRSLEIAVCALNDERGLRAILSDVDTIYHLASSENQGSRSNLFSVDVGGTTTICNAASDAHVKRIIFLSHLGADSASAYPYLKAKGISEVIIKGSKVDHTIIRSAIVYGLNDHFTTNLRRLIKMSPGFLYLPEDGVTLIQPLWVEDIATCLTWSLDNPAFANQTIEIGGPEYFSFKEVIKILMDNISIRRSLFSIHPVQLNRLTEFFEIFSKKFPASVFLIDYLAEDRICDLNSIPTYFNFRPSRFTSHLGHIHEVGHSSHK